MQQTIDYCPQAQQTRRVDHQIAGGAEAQGRFVRSERVGPLGRDHAATVVGKQQEKLKSTPAVELANDLQGLPLKDVCFAGDPDRIWKLVEAGSVSGNPSAAWIGGTCGALWISGCETG